MCCATPALAQEFIPTSEFVHGTIQDFEVMIHTKILDDERLGRALTEAYCGRNDYAPRTRDEARAYDPRGVEFLGRAWKMKRGGGAQSILTP